jgi:hypothetical protein
MISFSTAQVTLRRTRQVTEHQSGRARRVPEETVNRG